PQRPIFAVEDKIAKPYIRAYDGPLAGFQIKDIQSAQAMNIIGCKEEAATTGIERKRCNIVDRAATHIGKMLYLSGVEMNRRQIWHCAGMPHADVNHIGFRVVIGPRNRAEDFR